MSIGVEQIFQVEWQYKLATDNIYQLLLELMTSVFLEIISHILLQRFLLKTNLLSSFLYIPIQQKMCGYLIIQGFKLKKLVFLMLLVN